jgi:hypothetical protein
MPTMTYGTLPTREIFDSGWDEAANREDSPGGLSSGFFSFGNDSRMGTALLSRNELWDAIVLAHAEYEAGIDGDDVGDWLSCVLGCIGIEWV